MGTPRVPKLKLKVDSKSADIETGFLKTNLKWDLHNTISSQLQLQPFNTKVHLNTVLWAHGRVWKMVFNRLEQGWYYVILSTIQSQYHHVQTEICIIWGPIGSLSCNHLTLYSSLYILVVKTLEQYGYKSNSVHDIVDTFVFEDSARSYWFNQKTEHLARIFSISRLCSEPINIKTCHKKAPVLQFGMQCNHESGQDIDKGFKICCLEILMTLWLGFQCETCTPVTVMI